MFETHIDIVTNCDSQFPAYKVVSTYREKTWSGSRMEQFFSLKLVATDETGPIYVDVNIPHVCTSKAVSDSTYWEGRLGLAPQDWNRFESKIGQ